MEKKKYNITVGNETKEFEEGTTYQAVAKEFCGSFSHPAVLAVEGENRLQELRKTVEKDCELKFITTADAIGHETYKRSLCFLLVLPIWSKWKRQILIGKQYSLIVRIRQGFFRKFIQI